MTFDVGEVGDARQETRRYATRFAGTVAAAACWGLAVAVALVEIWARPAPAGQLPGRMTLRGFDARGPMHFVIGLILIPLLSAVASRPLASIVADSSTKTWARVTIWSSLIGSFWIALVDPSAAGILLWPLAPAIAAFLLRKREMRFSKRDAILVPVVLATFIALLDLNPGLDLVPAFVPAVELVLAWRLLLTTRSDSQSQPAYWFAISPLAMIAQGDLFAGARHLSWLALFIVFGSSLLLRFVQPIPSRRWGAVIALAIYPVVTYLYPLTLSAVVGEGRPQVNFFEAAHDLVPASQMLRGKVLYRDVIPDHGMIEDGLLDYALIRLKGEQLGKVLRGREAVATLNYPAMYFVALAATGSAELALFSMLLALLGGGAGWVRTVPALFTLSLLLYSVRRRSARWLWLVGIGVVLSFLTSVEFGVYTGMIVAVALLRWSSSGRRRTEAAMKVALGSLAVAAVAALILASYGVLGAFFKTTFVELPALTPVYALGFVSVPEQLSHVHFLPDSLGTLLDGSLFLYPFWILTVVGAGVLLAVSPFRSVRRTEPLLLTSLWVVVAAISYGERFHIYFEFAVPALLVATMGLLYRRRTDVARATAIIITLAVLILAEPTVHLLVTAENRGAIRVGDPNTMTYRKIPRARGALFKVEEGAEIESVRKYVSTRLRPDETFFDFTNRGLLYFLFDRNCPVRLYEVAFYESPAAQRELISRLESDRSVRAALVPNGVSDMTGIDGIPNIDRAPLVWQYLQEHFRPDFQEGDVIFWRRID